VAIYALKEQGKLGLGDKVFKNGNNGGILNLKGTRPKDPKVYDITVGQLLSHFGGWDNKIFGTEYSIAHRGTTFPLNGEFDPRSSR
jgi:CubicO group peptidase (beta-lactamase class C family)